VLPTSACTQLRSDIQPNSTLSVAYVAEVHRTNSKIPSGYTLKGVRRMAGVALVMSFGRGRNIAAGPSQWFSRAPVGFKGSQQWLGRSPCALDDDVRSEKWEFPLGSDRVDCLAGRRASVPWSTCAVSVDGQNDWELIAGAPVRWCAGAIAPRTDRPRAQRSGRLIRCRRG
jgi:hypothetical protein